MRSSGTFSSGSSGISDVSSEGVAAGWVLGLSFGVRVDYWCFGSYSEDIRAILFGLLVSTLWVFFIRNVLVTIFRFTGVSVVHNMRPFSNFLGLVHTYSRWCG